MGSGKIVAIATQRETQPGAKVLELANGMQLRTEVISEDTGVQEIFDLRIPGSRKSAHWESWQSAILLTWNRPYN